MLDESAVNAQKPPEKPADENKEIWYGVLYEPVSLRPIPNVSINFKRNETPFGWTDTGPDGRFSIEVVKLDTEEPMIAWVDRVPKGYYPALIADGYPPMLERQADDRRSFAADAVNVDVGWA